MPTDHENLKNFSIILLKLKNTNEKSLSAVAPTAAATATRTAAKEKRQMNKNCNRHLNQILKTSRILLMHQTTSIINKRKLAKFYERLKNVN